MSNSMQLDWSSMINCLKVYIRLWIHAWMVLGLVLLEKAVVKERINECLSVREAVCNLALHLMCYSMCSSQKKAQQNSPLGAFTRSESKHSLNFEKRFTQNRSGFLAVNERQQKWNDMEAIVHFISALPFSLPINILSLDQFCTSLWPMTNGWL